jgi:hypothetical protein
MGFALTLVLDRNYNASISDLKFHGGAGDEH